MTELLVDDGAGKRRFVHPEAVGLFRGEHAVLPGGKVEEKRFE
ncbi:hypothetical protein N803_10850 [Knoellia subterranea KCTC 19937]|uniref:Uncharacterized protein n=1 Tax=Knoellia subterranea KCTC 19937 TaxID=1385521 RepID=A0A0A0JRV7_9MICO|nr:hypothetical protein [Knoellia subterranea]KGN38341.1 hypothetical protein N803_10850 [Knoellia subterranea KCTC 19937]